MEVNSFGKEEEKVNLNDPASIILELGISYKPVSPYLEALGSTS